MTVPMLMPNSPTAYVSLEFGARAGAHAVVSACASGAEAIGYGVDMIRTGRADVVIAGGTEASIHPMPVAAFAASRTLSLRNDDPEGASRPYDVDRDGFVHRRGRRRRHPRERRARRRPRRPRLRPHRRRRPLRRRLPHHLPRALGRGSDPRDAGRARGVRDRAHRRRARQRARDVDRRRRPHRGPLDPRAAGRRGRPRRALGDEVDDRPPARRRRRAGDDLHVLALHDRQAPPTINVENPDPELVLDLVRDKPRALRDGDIAAVNNSFGFGGHNVALVVASV